jgi:hypothetical protein
MVVRGQEKNAGNHKNILVDVLTALYRLRPEESSAESSPRRLRRPERRNSDISQR